MAQDTDAAVELAAMLAHFSGSQTQYTYVFFGHKTRYRYTMGVRFLAENGSAYWLLDLVFSHQIEPHVKREPFQVWTLTRNLPGNSAVAYAEDGNGKRIAAQAIPYTEFPLREIKLYLENDVLMLPGER